MHAAVTDQHITESKLATFANRNRALEFLKELRRNPGAVKQKTDLRLALSIPEADMALLKARYPVLVQGGTHEKKRFWAWYMRQAESAQYRVEG
jgi:hypothetical protein